MTERMCIATRTVRPVEELVRFVVGPDGSVVPDILSRLPGRGVWVSADARALDEAVRRNLFSRAFKTAVRTGADLGTQVGDLLRRRALELLGLARKAGLARNGFVKIVEMAERENVALILNASDASRDGTDKLMRKISAARGGLNAPVVVALFASSELSLALGQPNVVHAALKQARLTDEIAAAAGKYERFSGSSAHESVSA